MRSGLDEGGSLAVRLRSPEKALVAKRELVEGVTATGTGEPPRQGPCRPSRSHALRLSIDEAHRISDDLGHRHIRGTERSQFNVAGPRRDCRLHEWGCHDAPATRQRVQDAMAELGYRPNLTARSLVTHRSHLIGVLATGLPHHGPATILTAIETAARAAGYTALVGIVDDASDDVDAVLDSFAARRVDAIAVIAPHTWVADAASAFVSTSPVLLVTAEPGGEIPSVGVDQHHGARLAVEHLIARDHRGIAHISGPRGWVDATQRIAGWRAALANAGLPVREPLEGDWSAERGRELGAMLASGDRPDAVFCGNDLTALGVMAAFRDAGLHVPGDIGIVGFDDMPGVGFIDPPLTTIRPPLADVGARCV